MTDNRDNNFNVGSRLRSLRELSGLSQREIARRASMTNANISQIEHSKISPSVQTLERLIAVFGLSLSDFFQLDLEPSVCVLKSADKLTWRDSNIEVSGFETSLLQSKFILAEAQLNAGASTQLQCLSHYHVLMGVVQQGPLSLAYKKERLNLKSGDGFRFSAHQEAELQNISGNVANFTLAGWRN